MIFCFNKIHCFINLMLLMFILYVAVPKGWIKLNSEPTKKYGNIIGDTFKKPKQGAYQVTEEMGAFIDSIINDPNTVDTFKLVGISLGKIITRPCSTDTIKGIIYFCGKIQTHSTVCEGYFITKCGGYKIGPFAEDIPTFIPSYFIRNDELRNDIRMVNEYTRQINSGRFTDKNFKTIPHEAIYGMIPFKK